MTAKPVTSNQKCKERALRETYRLLRSFISITQYHRRSRDPERTYRDNPEHWHVFF
jgi:hypothetical protein